MIDREIVWTETAEFDLDHLASGIANDRYDERLVFIVSMLDARRDLSGLLIERLVHDHAPPLD